MRHVSLLLLFACLSPLSFGQLNWIKHTYPANGFRVDRADFNNDGFPDLVVYDGASSTTIIPSTGNGAFDATHAFVTQALSDIVFLDFNRDGKIDMAACDGGNNLVVLQGNGDGTLTVTRTIPVACSWVATSDFNSDGNPDIAVGVRSPNQDSTNNQVIVYLGDGKGGVSSQVVNSSVDFISVDGDPCVIDGAAEAADFSEDKVADIVLTADCFNGTFSAAALLVGIGDGTGHFKFHKDMDFNFDAAMRLRLTDTNQDGHPDITAIANESAPHGSGQTALLIFAGRGDGTFALQEVADIATSDDSGDRIRSGAIADFDGDGIKDAILGVDTFDLNGNETHSLRFLKGHSDRPFEQIQSSSLASTVFDIVAADFDKNATADIALARPGSADVWINATIRVPICAATSGFHTVTVCDSGSPTGDFHFLSSPLNQIAVNAIQIYVDSVRKFETPDDLLSTNLKLTDGTHRITVKAWSNNGPFSNTFSLISCTNSTNRTVRICSPNNGDVFTSPGPRQSASVHIVASAATSLKFSTIQVYEDGKLAFSSTNKSLDTIWSGPSVGTHKITIKGWDSSGAFSNSVTVTVH